MFIQPIATRWKHTSHPVYSYQQSKPPHSKAVRDPSNVTNKPVDEVTVSNRSYQRLHNLHNQAQLEPINNSREAQELMGTIRSMVIEQATTTLYTHDVIPNSTVLNLLSPARLFSTSVDFQIHDYSTKAP